jgi:hypothetical protein
MVNQIGNSAERDKSLISTTSKLPIAPIKHIPNKIIPEAKDPIRKYFKPASLLLILDLLLEAKIQSNSTSRPKRTSLNYQMKPSTRLQKDFDCNIIRNFVG